MKELTKKDYEKELVRFCQILTQQRYDKEDDKMIKSLMQENLKHISSYPQMQRRYKKSILMEEVERLASIVVKTKFGTLEDKETKARLGLQLGELSRFIENSRQSREDAKIERELEKMISCF